MPVPQLKGDALDQAIEVALETSKVFPKQQAAESLTASGLSIPELATHLANLVYSAKDAVKLNAIRDAFALHGIYLKQEDSATSTPQIVFNITGENVQLNNMFAPQRDV